MMYFNITWRGNGFWRHLGCSWPSFWKSFSVRCWKHCQPGGLTWAIPLLPHPDTTVGVFHLRSPLGQYKLTFDKAKEACANEAATMATYNQLSYAQKVGRQLADSVQTESAGVEVQPLLKLGETWAAAFKQGSAGSSWNNANSHRVHLLGIYCIYYVSGTVHGTSLILLSILTTSLEAGQVLLFPFYR